MMCGIKLNHNQIQYRKQMKIYRILFSLIGLLFATATAGLSQGSLSGTVISADDQEPIPGVDLLIEGTERGTATDADGRYSIENIESGTYSLLVRFVGYRPVAKEFTIENGDDLTLNIELSQGSLNLDAIVVTDTGGPVEVRKLGNTVGVIGAAELQSTPVPGMDKF